MAAFPIITPTIPLRVIGRRMAGGSYTSADLIGHARALAEKLPEASCFINLCDDRYFFLVGFVAGLLRRQVMILPPSHAPAVLDQLHELHSDIYCLSDHGEAHSNITTFQFTPLEDHPASPLSVVIPPERVAAVLYTSGSTGIPTGHRKRWGELVGGARITGDRLGLAGLAGASVVATVPPQHMFGFETSIMLPLQWECSMTSARPFFPADLHSELSGLPGPRILVTTPLHLRACLSEGVTLPPLAFILSATAPLASDMAAEAERVFGCPVLEIYGCTEVGAVATRRTASGQQWRLMEGMELTCEGNRWRVRANHLPEAVVLNDDLRQTGEESFELLGRQQDLIKIAGKRASLGDLNHKLLEIDGVRDGVFFLPDDGAASPRLAAFVVAPRLSEADIIRGLRERIDAAFLPRPLCFTDALPRNATGKIPQAALREMLDACRRKK